MTAGFLDLYDSYRDNRTVKTTIINTAKYGIHSAAARGAEAIRQGKLVAFPTETVYGVGVDAQNAQALDRLRELKSRPKRPFTVHMGQADDAFRYVREDDMPRPARNVISKGWPGPVTLLVKAGDALADTSLGDDMHHRLVYEGYIGLRCPDEPLAQAMLCTVEEVVVAPSANLINQPAPHDAKQVLESLDGKIDLLIDSGTTRLSKESTILRVDGNGWEILRKGAVDRTTISKMATTLIVFVCTGNTCRSPMAAGIARRMLADKSGCDVAQLQSRGYEVLSAGLFAPDGCPASPEAVDAARAYNADISKHRSQRLTRELINRADVIFCMTEIHAQQVKELGGRHDVVHMLDAARDISDPVGGCNQIYEESAKHISLAMREVLKSRLL